MKKCSNCGSENLDEARFCQCCGNKLEPERKQYCDSCGAELSPGALFCKVCGKKLNENVLDDRQTIQPRKSNKNKLIIIGAIILIALVCIISVVVVKTKKGSAKSNVKAEKLLKDSGFVADSYNQLGFYRYGDGYKDEDDTDCYVYAYDGSDDSDDSDGSCYIYFDDNSGHFEGDTITQDSVDYILRKLYSSDDADNLDAFNKIRSDDEIIVYEQDYSNPDWHDDGDKHLLICICNTNKVFDVQIDADAFEEYEYIATEEYDDGFDGDGYKAVTRKKNRIFSDATYKAFIDTLRYTGSY